MAKPTLRKNLLSILLTLACALAYGEARAQFSFPYDPDFPEETPAEAPAERGDEEGRARPEPPPTEPLELPAWLREGGSFLLLDRPHAGRIFSAPAASAPARGFDEFMLEQKPFRVDQERWDRVREKVEKGLLGAEEPEPPPPPSRPPEFAIDEPQPMPPEPEVTIPEYGTSLSITGRKVIGFTFSEKRFLQDQKKSGRPQSTNLIDIQQQLQLRMQGKVGPKITVNVDYDDTKVNKQDISVVYAGDPNEVVQNASFGDIDLSLPATEFVSYNKQLFGIRVELKFKRFHAIFIGSRTKGQTKNKQFRGNTQFVTQDILDINYFRRRYYDLTFGDEARLPIRAGSERIFLARSVGGQQNVNEITRTVNDLAVPSSTFTGTFVQLSPGQDYTVDYAKGILTFKTILDESIVVAVDFIDETGASITQQASTNTADGIAASPCIDQGAPCFKLVKTFADVAIATAAESGYRRELKTLYSLGRSQIVRDDGRGNFFLKVLDQNRNEVGAALNPPQVYPETIEVDFENGIFQLDAPFSISSANPTVEDPDVYAPAPITKRLFQVEYRFRLKTFFLEPSLVLQSEVVLLDGTKLNRNTDYFIDYESGFLTFFNEERIRPDSVIDISYEVAPFAGNATESLLGTRISYDVTDKWSIGSTLLYQTGAKPPTVPSVNELAKSLLVYEFDTQLKNIQLFKWLSMSLQGEIAQSIQNPNLSKFALVENMEGVKQDDATAMLDNFWRIAANPTAGPSNHNGVSFAHLDEKVIDINPEAPANDDETQKVLELDYDFLQAGTTEVSIVYVFSPTGLDFSQKTILEVTLQQASNSGNLVNFHLGGINEDADGDAVFDTEDNGKDLLAGTNDIGERDGLLQPEEDIGYLYDPPAHAPASRRFGADNGLIDSEDLNRNGRLDPEDFSGDDYGYDGTNQALFDATSKSTRTALDFAGGTYHTFQIPLNIGTTNFTDFQAIKQVRFTVARGGGANAGRIRLARIAVVGNTWQRGQAGDPATDALPGAGENQSLVVNAVNNADNAEYIGRQIFDSPGAAQGVFNDLYGSVDELKKQGSTDKISEQALALQYRDLGAGTTVYTRRTFARAIDISQHGAFNFLVFGNADHPATAPPAPADAGEKTLFLRAGSDKDYFEVQVPINFGGWQKIEVRQVDRNGDEIPDAWEVGGSGGGAVAFSTGAPKLQQIGALIVGVYSSSGTKNTGSVYLNELYLSDPLTRKGTAEKLQADFTVPGWMSFGAKVRFVDRSYQTPTTVVSNQDNLQENAYLNFSRIRWFPMNFNLNYSKITTPNTNAVGNLSNTVSLLQQGIIWTWQGNATGNINLPKLPQISLAHERHRVEYDLASRLDDRKTYRTGASYTVPGQRRWLPRSINLDYNQSLFSVSFQDEEARLAPGNFDTDEMTKGYGAKLNFNPWSGTTLNPSYNATLVREDRVQHTLAGDLRKSYPKSFSQTAGFTSTWNLLRWLKPSISYTATTLENNILSVSTFTIRGSTRVFDIGDIKTVNRTGSGNISLTLRVAEIFQKTKLFRSFSMTNGYSLQDGDVYNNVERDLDTKTGLWLRTPLRPASPAAVRTTLTLRDNFNSTQRWSPLEAYDLAGRKAAFKTFSLSNNFVKNIQRTEQTGTQTKTISTTLPDIIASMSQLEKLTWSERFLRNFQMNLKYASRTTLNVAVSRDNNESFGTDLRAIIKKMFDTSISFNLRSTEKKDLRIEQVTERTSHKDATIQSTFDIRKFRFTSKVDYKNDVTTLGTGAKTQDTTAITPSLLIRADLSLPKGLKVPFSGKTLKFSNRVVWTTTLSFDMRSSPITIADNSKLFNLNTNADYEIAKNLRMTLNGAVSRLWHKFLKEDDFISYQFGTTLTFQF